MRDKDLIGITPMDDDVTFYLPMKPGYGASRRPARHCLVSRCLGWLTLEIHMSGYSSPRSMEPGTTFTRTRCMRRM